MQQLLECNLDNAIALRSGKNSHSHFPGCIHSIWEPELNRKVSRCRNSFSCSEVAITKMPRMFSLIRLIKCQECLTGYLTFQTSAAAAADSSDLVTTYDKNFDNHNFAGSEVFDTWVCSAFDRLAILSKSWSCQNKFLLPKHMIQSNNFKLF